MTLTIAKSAWALSCGNVQCTVAPTQAVRQEFISIESYRHISEYFVMLEYVDVARVNATC